MNEYLALDKPWNGNIQRALCQVCSDAEIESYFFKGLTAALHSEEGPLHDWVSTISYLQTTSVQLGVLDNAQNQKRIIEMNEGDDREGGLGVQRRDRRERVPAHHAAHRTLLFLTARTHID